MTQPLRVPVPIELDTYLDLKGITVDCYYQGLPDDADPFASAEISMDEAVDDLLDEMVGPDGSVLDECIPEMEAIAASLEKAARLLRRALAV